MLSTARSTLSAPTRKTAGASTRRRAKSAAPAPRLARDIAICPAKASVPDPFNPGSFETVTVNRRVDILADEFSKRRISQAELLVGRQLQAAWEMGSGSRLGSANWEGLSSCGAIATDGLSSAEVKALRLITDAKRAAEITDRASLVIGLAGVRFLRAVMCDTRSFAGYASKVGRGTGERAATAVAERFRWLLKDLVEGQYTAEGPERAPIRGGAVAAGAMRRPLGPVRR